MKKKPISDQVSSFSILMWPNNLWKDCHWHFVSDRLSWGVLCVQY